MITFRYAPKDTTLALEHLEFSIHEEATYSEVLEQIHSFLCAVGYADYGPLVPDNEGDPDDTE